MMTDDAIRQVIEERLQAVAESCNSTHIRHNEGVVRGLLWALNGKDPGTNLFHDAKQVYDLMGVPTRDRGDHFHYAMTLDPKELDEPCEFCNPVKQT